MDTYMERIKNGPPLKPQEEMTYESVRLSSYVNWPQWATKRPTELAENGFFHSGHGDRVVCFSCRGEIVGWRKDVIIRDKHRDMYPNCAFVNGSETRNQPIEKPAYLAEGANKDSFESPDLEEFFPKKNDHRDQSYSMDDLNRELSLGQSSNKDEFAPEATLRTHEPGTGPIDEIDLNFVKYENYRLRSFVGKWPENSFISPARLAKAGFYFFGNPDKVQCAFCQGRLQNWKPTDDPMSEHTTHFPHCQFVLGRDVGNVSIEESQSTVQMPKNMKTKGPPSRTQNLGVILDRAKHPEFSVLSTRLETFKTWPKKRVVAEEDLAKAGFFYVGYSDNVKCFFCDGGLRNWEARDDPWREHARWFSRCGFLKLQKGSEYIEEISSETSAGANSQMLPQNATLDLPEHLNSSMVRTVISMGFDKEMVENVVRTQRKTTGKDFPNVEDLLNALIEEEKMQENSLNSQEKPKHKLSRRQKRNKKSRESNRSPKSESKSSSSEDDNEKAVNAYADPTQGANSEVALDPLVNENSDVQSLMQDYQRIRDERMCKVCMDEECNVVFLPCGHLVCCANCAPALRTCPICRVLIKGTVRVYNT